MIYTYTPALPIGLKLMPLVIYCMHVRFCTLKELKQEVKEVKLRFAKGYGIIQNNHT